MDKIKLLACASLALWPYLVSLFIKPKTGINIETVVYVYEVFK